MGEGQSREPVELATAIVQANHNGICRGDRVDQALGIFSKQSQLDGSDVGGCGEKDRSQ